MQASTFNVDGMSCEHCVNAIKNALLAIPGVTAVEIVLKSRTVIVNGDSFSRDAVAAAITGLGYRIVE